MKKPKIKGEPIPRETVTDTVKVLSKRELDLLRLKGYYNKYTVNILVYIPLKGCEKNLRWCIISPKISKKTQNIYKKLEVLIHCLQNAGLLITINQHLIKKRCHILKQTSCSSIKEM